MPVQNVGKDVIDAYLHGRAIREKREERVAQTEQQMEMNRLRQEKMDNDVKKAERDFKETERWHDLQAEDKRTTQKFNTFQEHRNLLKAYDEGYLELIDPAKPLSHENSRETPKGTVALEQANKENLKAQARVAPTIDIAEGTAQVQQPFKKELLQTAGDIAGNRQLGQQNFLRDEHKLDREARIESARLRANAVASNKSATRQEADDANRDLVDTHLPGMFNGDITLEDLVKVSAKPRNLILAAGRTQGKILNTEEKGKLTDIKGLSNFRVKLQELNNEIAKAGLLGNSMNPRIAELQNELNADLVTFGRTAKGERGVVSDKDIVRLKGSIPQILPGGFRSISDKTGRLKANQGRVDDVKTLYWQKIRGIVGDKISPAQYEAFSSRFNLDPMEEDVASPVKK